MNSLSAGVNVSILKKLISFSVQVILLAAILGSSWITQSGQEHSRKSASVTSQAVEAALSQDCITSASITDFLFDASLDSNLFANFLTDFFCRKAFSGVAFFISGYSRNPFYTFITTNAP